MNFEKWIKDSSGKNYASMLQEVLDIEDPKYFEAWAKKQRLEEYSSDWAMFAIHSLSLRIKTLEKEKKDKK